MKSALNYKFLIIPSLLFSLVIGCNDDVKKPSVKPSETDNALNATYDPATNGLSIIDPRPKVSSLKLDEIDFRVNGLRVGLQDYMQSESPALFFFRPEMADYVEVLRCTADTIISAGGNTIGSVEFGTSSAEEETQIFQQSNFWAEAEKKNGCILIATNYSDKQLFIDGFAKSGNYRYIVRACVNQDRLIETQNTSTRNCSRQVSASTVLEDFKNYRIEEERLALEEAMKEQTNMDGLGRAIYYKIVELNNALVDCEKRETDRISNVQEKKAIGNAIGMGVSIAASIYAGGASGGGDSFSYMDGFKNVWNNKGSVAGGGSNLGAALGDIMTTSSDFPRSCSTAIKAKDDGKTLVGMLKASHELYAIKMDQATQARKNRTTLEDQ